MQEFVDFLGAQPPFDALSAEELQRLARVIKVSYFAAGTVVVDEGTAPLDKMWIVRSGQVEVVDRGRVIDVLIVGDTFGHASLLSGQRPAVSIRAAADTLCYELPDPRKILDRPEVLQFRNSAVLSWRQGLVRPGVMTGGQAPVSRIMRPVAWADPDDTVRSAAERITAEGGSCVLVHTRDGLGIATDRDFRSRVATGQVPLDAEISALLNRPVETISERDTVVSAQLRMVERGIHHLVVLDDSARPVGIVKALDLGSVVVRDPLIIRSAIDSAPDLAALSKAAELIVPTIAELSDNQVPALRIGALVAAVTESILVRLLDLNPDINGGPADTSWLVLGSLARREPLPGSDVDTAIVWSTPPGAPEDPERIRKGAKLLLAEMESCGLRRCPDGANADNPLFSRSQEQWSRSAHRWISEPTQEGALLLSSIVADSRPITRVTVGRTITDAVLATAQSQDFRELMLKFTTARRPPVGFVRGFVVEHTGRHRGGLDLKRGGLSPVTALARWLALVVGDVRGGTVERIRRGQDAGLLTGGEADALVGAFEDIYALAFEQEISALRNNRAASTWVTPENLDTLTRRHLRESFRAVSQVQVSVENEWRERLRR